MTIGECTGGMLVVGTIVGVFTALMLWLSLGNGRGDDDEDREEPG